MEDSLKNVAVGGAALAGSAVAGTAAAVVTDHLMSNDDEEAVVVVHNEPQEPDPEVTVRPDVTVIHHHETVIHDTIDVEDPPIINIEEIDPPVCVYAGPPMEDEEDPCLDMDSTDVEVETPTE